MDADIQALQRFAEVPHVVEAAASRTSMAGAALSALANARVTLDPKGLPVERYRELVARFRGDIAERLPSHGGWRIDALDRSADDPKAEGRRVDRNLAGYAEVLAGKGAGGAFSGPYQTRAGSWGCAITGFPPGYDFAARLSRPLGGRPARTDGLDAGALHWYALRHELGHCLLGSSESRAETFAALMALRDGRIGKEGLSSLARYREADEWAHPAPSDGHFVSRSLWEVVRRADALATSPAFMAMSMEDVASLARATSDRHALAPDGMEAMKAIRRGLRAAADAGPGAFRSWLAANSAVPEIGRYREALNALEHGAPAPRPFTPDAGAFARSMEALAARGDALATAALRGMAVPGPPPSTGADFVQRIPLARRSPRMDLRDLDAGPEALAPGMR